MDHRSVFYLLVGMGLEMDLGMGLEMDLGMGLGMGLGLQLLHLLGMMEIGKYRTCSLVQL
jgi:hypothetical protein